MKAAYPIILTKGKEFIIVYIPNFNINTQGKDLADAIEMARDAIGVMGIELEDEGLKIPLPLDIDKVIKENVDDIITLVDVDFLEYRRKNDTKTVRRNVSLPSWLNVEAEKAGINVSALLQMALKKELNIEKY